MFGRLHPEKDTINKHVQEEVQSSDTSAPNFAPAACTKKDMDSTQVRVRASFAESGPHSALSPQEEDSRRKRDCKRPGWRAECKELAHKLLFSEDSGNKENPQKNHSDPSSDYVKAQEIQSSPDAHNSCKYDIT